MFKAGEYALLGLDGEFVPVACTGQISLEQNKQYTSGISLEGNRRVLVYGQNLMRTWKLSGDLPLHCAKNLLSVAYDSQLTHYALNLVTPLAQLGNVLASGFLDNPSGMSRLLPEGGYVKVVPQDGNKRRISDKGFVQTGDTVTGSVWVETSTKTARVSIEFFNGAGKWIGAKGVDVPAATTLKRYSVTTVVPDGGVMARVVVTGDFFFAGNPAVTWGSELRDYLPPQGANKVYLEPLSYSFDDLSFMVKNCSDQSKQIVPGVSISILEVA